MPAICGECGTTIDDEEFGFCENDHDTIKKRHKG
jgi:hypothetical protein